MSPLSALLIVKILVTLIFVVVPLVEGNAARFWSLTDILVDPREMRVVGYAFIGLLILDAVATVHALEGRFPRRIVVLGIVTNAAAVAALFTLGILPTIAVLLGAFAVLLTAAAAFPETAAAPIRRHP